MKRLLILCVLILCFLMGGGSALYVWKFHHLSNMHTNLRAYIYNPSKYLHYLTEKSDNNLPIYKLNILEERRKSIQFQRDSWIYSWDQLVLGKQWKTRTDFYTKAKLYIDSNVHDVNIRLFGLNNDHISDPIFWSFRVKSKKFITEIGNTRFNLLRPDTRDYFSDVLCNQIFKESDLIYLNYKPINLAINDSDFDVYFMEDHFSKYIIERTRRRDGYLFTDRKIKHPKKLTKLDSCRIDSIKKLMSSHPEKIFDYDKFYSFLALVYISQDEHPMVSGNLHCYYNPISNKIEPLIREVLFAKELSNFQSFEELHSDVKSFFQRSSLSAPHSLLNSIIQDESRLNLQTRRVLEINTQISHLLKTPDWIDLEKIIYSRYPKALYECKNIYNNNSILNKIALEDNLNAQVSIGDSVIENDITLNEDYAINNGNLKILAKSKIDLNGYNIILYNGSLMADGTNGRIYISNSSHTSSSIIAYNGENNLLKNVSISGISNYETNTWRIPSALTFYETNVRIEDCTFSSNRRGDDFLNIFRCDSFDISNTSFSNILSDALDVDFSNGKVTNCEFKEIGNDAIDGSESNLKIVNTIFNEVKDKAITCGENSNFTIENSIIQNSEIAFVSKDGSCINEHNNQLISNTLDYCVFKKKKQFRLGKLITDKNISETKYLIQTNSQVFENNKKVMDLKFLDDVEMLLYGTLFGKKTAK